MTSLAAPAAPREFGSRGRDARRLSRSRVLPIGRCLCLLVVSTIVAPRGAVAGEPPVTAERPKSNAPYFDRRALPLEYVGPGREDAEDANVSEVRIGYFGPDSPAHPDGGDLWCAASLAIEEANLEGGYGGKPFRLVARWSDDPWTGGAAHVTRMVYTERVWAILGGIDSTSTHLAEQVAAKALLPLVCASSSDRTTNSAIVPWVFSLLPGNQLQAPVLAELADRTGRRPFVVIAGEDHESRSFMAELARAIATLGLAPQFQLVYRPADSNAADVARRAIRSDPAAIVLVADPRGTALLVRELRGTGFHGLICAGPAAGRRRFLEEVGDGVEGVIFPLLVQPGEKWPTLEAAFRERYQRSLDFAAASTYDAVHLLVAAIRKAGLNRARIGDALRELSPWNGLTGTVRWDNLGGNTRPVQLGVFVAGRVERVPARSPGRTP